MDVHQGVLDRLHKQSISAGDISTQAWCEKQLELNCIYGREFTQAMKYGREVHAEFQEKVFVYLPVKPKSYPESLFKTAYENYMSLRRLKEEGLCREVMVYGSINGYRLIGKIDELKIEDGHVKILEYKTIDPKNFNHEPYTRPHLRQIKLYRRILNEMREKQYMFENFANTYKIKEMRLSEEFIKELDKNNIGFTSMNDIYKKMFDEIYTLPEISDKLTVRYISRKTGEEIGSVELKYEDSKMDEELVEALKYWNGEREAKAVPEEESWKCRTCRHFGNKCTTWWPNKKLVDYAKP